MNAFERWSLVAAFGAIVVNVVVFGTLTIQLRLVARQVRLTQRSSDLDHDRRRRQATLEMSARFVKTLTVLRQDGLPDDYQAEAVNAFQDRAIAGDPEARALLEAYLNEFEQVAIGTRFDVFDHSILDRTMGRLIIVVAQQYQPFIAHRRKASGNADISRDLQWLASRIADGREPAPEVTVEPTP